MIPSRDVLSGAQPKMKHLIVWLRERFANLHFRRRIDCFESWFENVPQDTHSIEQTNVNDKVSTDSIRSALAEAKNIVRLGSLFNDRLYLLHDAKCTFSKLKTTRRPDGNPLTSKFHIVGSKIHELELNGVSEVVIQKCRIGVLTITNASTSAELSDTWVEKLAFEGVLQELVWTGGYLGSATIPATAEMRGDIILRGVYISADRKRHGIQWLRDIRRKFTEKNNLHAASVFHPTELLMNRATDPWSANVVSYFYGLGSNFGNSIGRAALCLLVVFVGAFLVGWIGGTTANTDGQVGWLLHLNDGDCGNKSVRTFLYALNTTFNPINLIVSKPLVAPEHSTGALIGSFLSIFGAISFALLVLGIRRRFKID
jgi:hypothetical protein